MSDTLITVLNMERGSSMKKFLSLALTAAISVSCLTACSQESSETTTEETEPTEVTTVQTAETFETQTQTTTAPAETTSVEASVSTEVTPELNDLFTQALDGFVGVGYTPELFLGSFDQDGTIYCFLCNATVVVPDAVPYWAIVYIRDDGSGNVSISKVYQPGYEAMSENYGGDTVLVEDSQAPLPGGWTTTEDLTVDEDTAAKFRIANSLYDPIAVLATKTDDGTYYCFIASDSDGALKFVFIHMDSEETGATLGSNLIDIESLY